MLIALPVSNNEKVAVAQRIDRANDLIRTKSPGQCVLCRVQSLREEAHALTACKAEPEDSKMAATAI